MKREDLKSMGLTDEQIENIMAENGKDVQAEIDKANVVIAERDTLKTQLADRDKDIKLKTQLADRDKDIKDLQKKTGDNTDLQQQLSDLQTKYKNETAELNQKLADQKLDSALDNAIHAAKGRNPKAIKALIDRTALKLKEDGSIDGLDLDALKTSDAYLFEIESSRDEGTGATGSSGGSGNEPSNLREALALEMGQKG